MLTLKWMMKKFKDFHFMCSLNIHYSEVFLNAKHNSCLLSSFNNVFYYSTFLEPRFKMLTSRLQVLKSLTCQWARPLLLVERFYAFAQNPKSNEEKNQSNKNKLTYKQAGPTAERFNSSCIRLCLGFRVWILVRVDFFYFRDGELSKLPYCL